MIAATLLLAAAMQGPTAEIPVTEGDRLRVVVDAGSVTVRTADVSHVQASALQGVRVSVTRGGSVITVRPHPERGQSLAVVMVTVPRWMPVAARTRFADITIIGAQGGVSAISTEGDIVLEAIRGPIAAHSTNGSVSVHGGHGPARLSSVNGRIDASDVLGDSLLATTTNGGVLMDGIRVGGLTATTVNGDVTFTGDLAAGGLYVMATHRGDVTAQVRAAGGVESELTSLRGTVTPLAGMRRLPGSTITWGLTLGEGAARLQMQNYEGRVTLTPAPPRD